MRTVTNLSELGAVYGRGNESYKSNENNKIREIRRGDIYWCILPDMGNHTQRGKHPIMIVSNNKANKHSTVLSAVGISSQIQKCKLPTHVLIEPDENNGLQRTSFVQTEQIFPVDKSRLGDYIGFTREDKINKAIEVSLGLREIKNKYEEIVMEKVKDIKQSDMFIQMWIDKKRDINMISDYVEDRKIKIKDLIFYCSKYNIDINDYYDLNDINSKNKRLVG